MKHITYNLSATVKHEVDDVKLQFISLFLFYLFIISVKTDQRQK